MLLITGATGLVGSHVAEKARKLNLRTRALVRKDSDTRLLDEWGVEKSFGEMTDAESLQKAVQGVTIVIHCAAKVGDWGPVDEYRAVNVRAVENLLAAAESAGTLKQFIHVSSLGVYEGRDHHGTDETTAPSTTGLDGYTLTKVEAEQVVLRHIREKKLPATLIRPGFIYGPRDRTVLPRLLERLKKGQVKFFGSGEQLMNNTFVGNLVDAIFLSLNNPKALGEIFIITDGILVSKKEFITTAAREAGYKLPTGSVPLGVAKVLTSLCEGLYRLLKKKEAPLLSKARYKFLGLNLDFCIDKARRVLGYEPAVPFAEAMHQTIDWFRREGKL